MKSFIESSLPYSSCFVTSIEFVTKQIKKIASKVAVTPLLSIVRPKDIDFCPTCLAALSLYDIDCETANNLPKHLAMLTKLQKKGVTMNTENVGNQQISRRKGLLGDAIRDFLRYACDPQDYRHGHTKRNLALVELEKQAQWFHEHNIPIHIDYSHGWLFVSDG